MGFPLKHSFCLVSFPVACLKPFSPDLWKDIPKSQPDHVFSQFKATHGPSEKGDSLMRTFRVQPLPTSAAVSLGPHILGSGTGSDSCKFPHPVFLHSSGSLCVQLSLLGIPLYPTIPILCQADFCLPLKTPLEAIPLTPSLC